MSDTLTANRIIFGLRVIERSTRRFVSVHGTDARGVLAQDAQVYENSPYDFYAIERLTGTVNDYIAAFPECAPAADAPAQEWAEFMWTPGH